MSAINKSSPTEIIGKVMGSDTMKSAHPLFEPTSVGIDVLNVVDLGDNPNACGQIDRAMGNAHFPSGGANALPLSVQRTASLANMGKSAAPTCILSAFFRTKSLVVVATSSDGYPI